MHNLIIDYNSYFIDLDVKRNPIASMACQYIGFFLYRERFLPNIGQCIFVQSRILENTEWGNIPQNIPQNFFQKLQKWFQMVWIYPSMSWRIFGNVIRLIWHNLETMECSAEHSVFSRLCHISLITFPKIFQLIEGYIQAIWNSLGLFLRLLRKRSVPENTESAELFSKTSEMVPNGLNIPMYEP